MCIWLSVTFRSYADEDVNKMVMKEAWQGPRPTSYIPVLGVLRLFPQCTADMRLTSLCNEFICSQISANFPPRQQQLKFLLDSENLESKN